MSKKEQKPELSTEKALHIDNVRGSADVEVHIIDPNSVNYNPYEDRC
jgi:hypothetical protein